MAKLVGSRKASQAREFILQYLEEFEDIHIAERRLADLDAGRSHTVALAKVMNLRGMKV